jgi:transcriptional regulator with XRE-family HTH domain
MRKLLSDKGIYLRSQQRIPRSPLDRNLSLWENGRGGNDQNGGSFIVTDTTTLARRQLGSRLRTLREKAHKTIADVETAGIGSASKIWRIESGRASVRSGDVRELCFLYRAPQRVLDPLLALARATKGGGWWEDYTDVLFEGFGLYLDLEAAASSIRTYDAELIHGLLQTPEYHRAIGLGEGSDEVALRRSEDLRQERRRQVLGSDSACRLTAVLGEAALHRVVGSTTVMANQVASMAALARADEVEVRVLPWQAGAHAGIRGGAFTLMDFPDEADPDIVYLETHTAARYLEQEAQLHRYRQLWEILKVQSVPLEEFIA